MKWYFPSWTGDFRLIANENDPARSLLEIKSPTPAEVEALTSFLLKAKKRKWIERVPAIDVDDATVAIAASVAEAGGVLVGEVKPADRTISAVKSAGGKIEVVDSLSPGAAAALVEEAAKEEQADEAAGKKGKKGEAVSAGRPTPCCPDCVPGSVERASEVLLAFLDDREHADWRSERALTVVGGMSGHEYVIAHRHSRRAVAWTRICFDATDGRVLKFHDWSVPPEEEVLATKLILEHREDWIRNEATCLGCGFTDVFKNPFGDILDGVEDSALVSAFGGALIGSLAGLS